MGWQAGELGEESGLVLVWKQGLGKVGCGVGKGSFSRCVQACHSCSILESSYAEQLGAPFGVTVECDEPIHC